MDRAMDRATLATINMQTQQVMTRYSQQILRASTDPVANNALWQFTSAFVQKSGADTEDPQGRILGDVFSRYYADETLLGWEEAGSVAQAATELHKGEIAKAGLDVGQLTNLANVVGGQTLGWPSIDTHIKRSTIRPMSFTLYNALPKSAAQQIVDFWPVVEATGGALPGSAGELTSSVWTTPSVNAGFYQLKTMTLKLFYDMRAISTVLGVTNNFANVGEQETINATLSLLSTIDWAAYWGNEALYPTQFQGLYPQMLTDSTHTYNFPDYVVSQASQGKVESELLFDIIYASAGALTTSYTYSTLTHCFMDPDTYAGLGTVILSPLNNLVNITEDLRSRQVIVNGHLSGIDTGFGEAVRFERDVLIAARNTPAAGIFTFEGSGVTREIATMPVPATVTAAVVAVPAAGTLGIPTTGLNINGFSVGASGTGQDYVTNSSYYYAVASVDEAMNESALAFLTSGATPAGIAAVAGSAIQLTITPPATNTNVIGYRVYRTGSLQGITTSATAFRYIGEIASNGNSAVAFYDTNSWIPGAGTIFLLDMKASDGALDYRYLLPPSKIDLYAGNLQMPWAIAMIGGLRVDIPKFHGVIKNITLPSLQSRFNYVGINA